MNWQWRYLTCQNYFRPKKNFLSYPKFEDLRVLFVQILLKVIEKDSTGLILFLKFLMLIWKILKHRFG